MTGKTWGDMRARHSLSDRQQLRLARLLVPGPSVVGQAPVVLITPNSRHRGALCLVVVCPTCHRFHYHGNPTAQPDPDGTFGYREADCGGPEYVLLLTPEQRQWLAETFGTAPAEGAAT